MHRKLKQLILVSTSAMAFSMAYAGTTVAHHHVKSPVVKDLNKVSVKLPPANSPKHVPTHYKIMPISNPVVAKAGPAVVHKHHTSELNTTSALVKKQAHFIEKTTHGTVKIVRSFHAQGLC